METKKKSHFWLKFVLVMVGIIIFIKLLPEASAEEIPESQILNMEGHPVLFSKKDETEKYYKKLDSEKIITNPYNYDENVVLSIGFSCSGSVNDYYVNDIEIYPKDDYTLNQAFKLACDYIPLDVLKYYEKRYARTNNESYIISYFVKDVYRPIIEDTGNGTGINVRIEMKNGYAELIRISEHDLYRSRYEHIFSDEWEDWDFDF